MIVHSRTPGSAAAWIRRFFRFQLRCDPNTLDHDIVAQFLSVLAVKHRVSASTQNQARSALVFYFRHVRGTPLPMLEGVTPASRSRRLPVVLSGDEVLAVLRELSGAKRLVGMLLYGSGLRLLEALSLRVKDLDFARSQLMVRSGKGDKDRATVSPRGIHEALRAHLVKVKRLHERDLIAGAGHVRDVRTGRGVNGRSDFKSRPRLVPPPRLTCAAADRCRHPTVRGARRHRD